MKEPRLGPPPIEPLSEIGWARVEKKLWEQLDGQPARTPLTPRARWPWLVAPVLAAAAVVLVIVIATRPSDPHTPERPSLDTPARMVSNEAPSTISFGDAHVTLDPRSAVVMSTAAPNALLEYGAAWFAISPREDRPAFVVLAGDTTIRVVGTRFRVARSAEHVTVEVDRGVVEIQFHETKALVRGSQRWTTETGSVTQLAQNLPPATITGDDPLVTDPAQPPTTNLPAAKDPPAPPTKPPAAKPPTKPAPPTTKPAAADLDSETFKRLTASEAHDPAGTITGYLALAKRPGRYSAMALFAAGRLAADRRDPRARSLLESYLRQFPRGPNADDARELIAHLKGATR